VKRPEEGAAGLGQRARGEQEQTITTLLGTLSARKAKCNASRPVNEVC
jgi:hypothetical protein